MNSIKPLIRAPRSWTAEQRSSKRRTNSHLNITKVGPGERSSRGRGRAVDEDLRHESYKGHDITSRPVSVDLPGSERTWQVRIYRTSPDQVTRNRLLETPYYK